MFRDMVSSARSRNESAQHYVDQVEEKVEQMMNYANDKNKEAYFYLSGMADQVRLAKTALKNVEDMVKVCQFAEDAAIINIIGGLSRG
jgi:outer membrane protein TolC